MSKRKKRLRKDRPRTRRRGRTASMPGHVFTREQPKDGETILRCEHALTEEGDAGKKHFYRFQTPANFVRPDGSKGVAQWAVCCQACHERHGQDLR